MLHNKYIVKATNVLDDEGTVLPPFYLGEDHLDHGRLSHDIFEFDTVVAAKRNCDKDNYVSNFANAVFTIQLVNLIDCEEIT